MNESLSGGGTPRIVPGTEGVDTRDMPAGHSRDEQQRRNADTLAEQAEADPREAIDTARLQRARDDRDIRQRYEPGGFGNPYNRLRVQNALPGFMYALVCTRGESVQVDMKLAEMVPDADGYAVPVWEIVQGGADRAGTIYPEARMVEALNWRDVNGFRRVGDCILMRARKDRWQLLQGEIKKINDMKNEPDAGTDELRRLEGIAQRQGRGVAVHVNSPLADPQLRRAANHAASRGIARSQFDEMLREGRVPGAEVRR